MAQLLLEGTLGAVPFIVNRDKPFVTEERHGNSYTRIPGRFSVCDSINGNGRRYPRKVWEKNLSEGSTLRQSIAKNGAFGLLEHPSNGQISLLSPICIAVTDAKLSQAVDSAGKRVDEVVGEITVLNTLEGQKLKALIEFGYNPLVSSRGFGSVVRASDGVDEVQEDYVCEGWDVVLRPSFENAELWPTRPNESTKTSESTEAKEKEKALSENKTEEPAKQAPAAKTSEKPPQTEAKASDKPTMNINEIKTHIVQFGATKVPTDPAQFAEGMSSMSKLHQEIANFVAEDARRSWDGQQLHEQVTRIERSWSEAAQAPSRKATKLTENYGKVLKVTKVLGEAAVSMRAKLTEALKQSAEAGKLVEEVTQRGQSWMAYATSLKEKLALAEHKLEVTCDALDILAERYNQDVSDLGKHVLTLEFAEATATPEMKKALKEATTPKAVIAIREQLTGKKASAKQEGEMKGKEDEEKGKEKAGEKEGEKDMKESKGSDDKKLSESKGSDTAGDASHRVLVPSVRTITESVAMVERLSKASAQ